MKQPKLLLGFDFGSKQIGIAVGQALTRQARPLSNLKARDGIPNWDDIAALIKEWQPDALVVGLPLNMDGSASEMSIRAEKFARRLHGRFGLPVHTQDERLTTFAAKSELPKNQRNSSQKNALVDDLAAAILLEDWLKNLPPTNN